MSSPLTFIVQTVLGSVAGPLSERLPLPLVRFTSLHPLGSAVEGGSTSAEAVEANPAATVNAPVRNTRGRYLPRCIVSLSTYWSARREDREAATHPAAASGPSDGRSPRWRDPDERGRARPPPHCSPPLP